METLAMSKKERRRLELFNRVREGAVTLVKASAPPILRKIGNAASPAGARPA